MDNKLTIEEFGQAVKINYPQYAGMSDKEIGEKTLAKYPEYQNRIKAETGFVADVKAIGSGIKKSFGDAVKSVDKSQEAQAKGEQSGLRTLGHTAGQTAGFISDSIGEVVIGAIKAVTPQPIQEKVGETVTAVAQGVAESQPAQEMVEWYQGLDEVQQRDVDASLGVLGLALDVAGGALIKNPVKAGVTKTVDAVGDATKATVKTAGQAVDTVSDVAKPATNFVKDTAEVVTDVPRRLKANIDANQQLRDAVQALPSDTARTAVRDGIDINDVRQIYRVTDPNTQASFKKLHETVKAFEKGETTTNPIELVGKPIVTRLKTLDSEAGKIGQELGEIANNLGDVTSDELNTAVIKRLTEIRGMDGLKVADDGTLDFTDTVLASALSKSDQTAINEIFQEATKAGTGKSKHLLRQELFELLNGKKQSLQNITGTQERAYQAVRQGLADVLDSKNELYKQKNMEYAKIITPVTEMRKLMRQLDPDVDEDILDMSAGLLARRLTSNSSSNPKIRLLLRQLDEASKVEGKTALSVEQLQDYYNILERYYDIAGKTGFQGQVTSAIEKGGIMAQGAEFLRKLGGRSDAVRQKALEDLILEVYGQ